MKERLILTPEQLFFLGTVMGAEYINYDYIAAMGEVQRNYTRTHRKCMDDLARAGLLRERLSGEVALRPIPRQLLHPVFFGKKESSIEIFTLGKEKKYELIRFHWSEDSITEVWQNADQFVFVPSSQDQMEALILGLIRGAERPMRVGALLEESVTRIITAKRATVGEESTGVVLFEIFGSLHTMDEDETLHAVPASQARAMLLAELKGE